MVQEDDPDETKFRVSWQDPRILVDFKNKNRRSLDWSPASAPNMTAEAT